MANATPRDTRAGFDIFRSAGGDLSLDELNRRLVEAGYGPVSNRSLKHFRSLLDAGYDRYVSINRFDIARAAEPYESASANPRYRYTAVDSGVTVMFAKRSELYEASGRATEVGEAGALIDFDNDVAIRGIAELKPRAGDMLSVRFLETGRSAGGRIIEVDTDSRPAHVEIEYSGLISLSEEAAGAPLPTTTASFVLRSTDDDRLTVDLAGRRLYHFFELLEGVRSVVNTAGRRSDRSSSYAAPPVLRRLSIESPALVVLDVAQVVQTLLPAGLLKIAITGAFKVAEFRKTWHEGSVAAKEDQLKQLEINRTKADHELTKELVERIRNEFGDGVDGAAAERAIRSQVLPPLRRLGESGVEEIANPDEDERTE